MINTHTLTETGNLQRVGAEKEFIGGIYRHAWLSSIPQVVGLYIITHSLEGFIYWVMVVQTGAVVNQVCIMGQYSS